MSPKQLFQDYLLPLLLLSAGAALAAFALEEFLVPAHILDGGVTGVSMILNHLTAQPLSIFVLALNLPFLLVGFRQFGSGLWSVPPMP